MPYRDPPSPPLWYRIAQILIVGAIAGYVVLMALLAQVALFLWLSASLSSLARIVLWISFSLPLALASGVVAQRVLPLVESSDYLLAWLWVPRVVAPARRIARRRAAAWALLLASEYAPPNTAAPLFEHLPGARGWDALVGPTRARAASLAVMMSATLRDSMERVAMVRRNVQIVARLLLLLGSLLLPSLFPAHVVYA